MANDPLSLNYTLPKDSYIAFDALTLRQLIISRLNEQGVFTDQNYIGSNLACIIDIVSYTFNTLIYYLNKTSTESMFTEAQLYENITRIVNLLGYKPLGYQTSLVAFELFVNKLLDAVSYTIPRYSYIKLNNIVYSLNEDVVFARSYVNSNSDTLQVIQGTYSKFLVQGQFKEYGEYQAIGDSGEIVNFIFKEDTYVDHYNIHIYVKSLRSGKWEKYDAVETLYLENSQSLTYEIRLNTKNTYEIKFGDDVNSKKLQQGDIVKIFYLVSTGNEGVISSETFIQAPLIRYNSLYHQEILNDLLPSSTLLTDTQIKYCYITNINNSTLPRDAETIEQIKLSAPNAFKSQYRLVREDDYKVFIKSNFSNLAADVYIINNTDYMSTYIKYYHDLGLTNPSLNMRALFNQILFSSSCNFNNVYVVVVPKSFNNTVSYLLPTQKQLIKTSVDEVKIATTETVFVDPVYIAFAIGTTNELYETFDISKQTNTKIKVTKTEFTKRSNISIQIEVKEVVSNYFSQTNCTLGQLVNIRNIEREILSIDGVEKIQTYRNDNTEIIYNGLSFFAWNPSYSGYDKHVLTGDIQLKSFQYPYLKDIDILDNKIEVV